MTKEKWFNRLEERLYDFVKDKGPAGILIGGTISLAGAIAQNDYIFSSGAVILGLSGGYTLATEDKFDNVKNI